MKFNTRRTPSSRYEGGFDPYIPSRHVPILNKLLPNYLPSPEHSQRISNYMSEIGFAGVVGAAASGKNALIGNTLGSQPDTFTPLLSVTSRPKRLNGDAWEEEGVHYYYRQFGEIINSLHSGEFIEAALIHESQISGQRVDHLDQAYSSGKIVLNEFEIGGAVQLRRIEPTWRGIAVVPDDPELHQRVFAARNGLPEGTMNDDMRSRNLTAIWELDGMLKEPEGYAPFVNRFSKSSSQEDIDESISENSERFMRLAVQAKNGYEGFFYAADFDHIGNMRDFLLSLMGVEIDEVYETRGQSNTLAS